MHKESWNLAHVIEKTFDFSAQAVLYLFLLSDTCRSTFTSPPDMLSIRLQFSKAGRPVFTVKGISQEAKETVHSVRVNFHIYVLKTMSSLCF